MNKLSDSRIPYSSQDPKIFWRTGVAERLNQINYDIYKKKFLINRDTKIATAGSCFAQHIGNTLREKKFNVLDCEVMPWYLPQSVKSAYSYGIYSGRYGNIYTVRQMLQLVKEVFGLSQPENIIWKNNQGKFIDALRPGIEPNGFDSVEELLFHRSHHILQLKELFIDMDLLIFTLGLTEAWQHKISKTIYPIVPSAVGCPFDPDVYEFVNFTFEEINKDLVELMSIFDQISHKKNYLFTVSPVPLTATATDDHVLVATTYSKSVLRAVVGEIYKKFSNVDYFPSYEIVINPWSKTKKYADNQRSVLPQAVKEVMTIFLNQHGDEILERGILNEEGLKGELCNEGDVVCEEILLELLNKERE